MAAGSMNFTKGFFPFKIMLSPNLFSYTTLNQFAEDHIIIILFPMNMTGQQ